MHYVFNLIYELGFSISYKIDVRTAKTQISMRIYNLIRVFAGSLWVSKDSNRLQANSEDSEVPVLVLTLCCFVVYSTRRFVLSLPLCYFVLVFISPFSIAIISLEEERADLDAFRAFVRFALVWFCLFPLPLGVWDGLRLVIVALPGLFSYLF